MIVNTCGFEEIGLNRKQRSKNLLFDRSRRVPVEDLSAAGILLSRQGLTDQHHQTHFGVHFQPIRSLRSIP